MTAKNRAIVTIICTAVLVILVTISTRSLPDAFMTNALKNSANSMKISSSAFGEGQAIPKKYTCDGQEMSPPLAISGVPKEAKSLALILDDPDTSIGTFTHWVVFNIPPETTAVHESMPKTSPTFGTAGKNSTGSTDYIGPCPPTGTHRYVFKLTALDAILPLSAGASKEDVLKAAKGHEIAETELIGMFGRK